MSFSRATVVETSQLNTRLRRIVLHIASPDRLVLPDSADAAVGIYFPPPGKTAPPPMEFRRGAWGYHDPDTAPQGRNYSVRHHDPGSNRITVDIVLHATGVATDWARRAAPGHQLVLSHARSWYRPEPTTDWQLVVADLAGLPAAARILSELTPQTMAVAVVEVLDEDDLTYLSAPSNVTVTASVGTGNGQSESVLSRLVAELDLPAGRGYCWFAGEAAQSRSARKYLRGIGWTADQFDIVGYWRFDSEAWDRKYAAVAPEVLPIYEQALADGKGDKAAAEEFDEALERAGL
jgi:NADPH-dependent ferric siderophore reductase